MAFSTRGLIVGLAVPDPNLLLAASPPGTPRPAEYVPRPLGWIERGGQALCVAFLSAAAWLSSPWITVAAATLAVGHIPASAIIARTVHTRP